MSRKWYYLAISLFLVLGSAVTIAVKGIPWGVDFRGGTIVQVKFTHAPDLEKIRTALTQVGLRDPRIQAYGAAGNNEVLISLEERETTEEALDRGKNTIVRALSPEGEGKTDINNVGATTIGAHLLKKDPMRLGTDAAKQYQDIAQAIVSYRDRDRGGVLGSLDELQGHAPSEVVNLLKADYYASDFGVRNVDIVGPQVGAQLTRQALLATIYSLAGMLIYIWFRFELIYGVGAVIACFHDAFVTLGFFSLIEKEVSLTVVAALLTLIGYSMNDTIVIFDRVRENIKLLRRESIPEIVNRSVNDTLSRTILTSGLTFISVLSLYLFGGEVLGGFSLALVVGILIGTWSTVAVAAPMVAAYQEWRAKRARGGVPVAKKGDRDRVKA